LGKSAQYRVTAPISLSVKILPREAMQTLLVGTREEKGRTRRREMSRRRKRVEG
jgi:hypothetical protein